MSSIILADAVRQVDYRERETQFVAEVPAEIVEEVLDKLFAAVEEQ